MNAPINETAGIIPECPFAPELIEAATKTFLMDGDWKRVYDNAPEGARRRLEISFFFTARRSYSSPFGDAVGRRNQCIQRITCCIF